VRRWPQRRRRVGRRLSRPRRAGNHVNGDCAAATVAPESLPECDVLEIDAEGAETAILRWLEIRPRVIVVEAHAHRGAPAEKVRELSGQRYEVVDRQVEDPEKGVEILTAVRDE